MTILIASASPAYQTAIAIASNLAEKPDLAAGAASLKAKC
jgi:hypothetical protein